MEDRTLHNTDCYHVCLNYQLSWKPQKHFTNRQHFVTNIHCILVIYLSFTFTRQEFLREVSWLASIRDPNLTRIIGICGQEEPLCVIQEHSDLGDLPQFLQLQSLAAEEGAFTLR